MDKKKSLLNVSVAIIFQFLILIGNILVRRYLIRYIGNEFNGLNSLYTSILNILAVAELGVGTAITFCMYKPIVEGNIKKVSALYHLFTKLYLIIGTIIFVAGLIVMPLLPYIAKDYQSINVNLYLTFGLMLISVVLTYVYSSKSSLINAYKNNYITTTITSVSRLFEYTLQIIVLIFTNSFVCYLECVIVGSIIQWILTEIVARKKYYDVVSLKEKVNDEEKKEVTKNIKAIFMHRIGGALVNTADSVIISAFIGIAVLGKYSNYITIMTATMSVLNLFFTPLTAIIGHLFVEKGKDETNRYFNFFHTFNFILGLIFFLGYYAVVDNLITLLFDDGLEFIRSITFVITLNYFIQFMEQSVRLFKDSTGMFYYDRWKCIFEGILNISLSILFVIVFPEKYSVIGVIIATIITNLTICHVVEPHVLYKYTFQAKTRKYYIKNYIYISVFTLLLFAVHFSLVSNDNNWFELFANGGISLIYSIIASIIVIMINRDFKTYSKNLIRKIINKFKIIKQ